MIRTGYLPPRMFQRRTVLIVVAVALVTGLIVRFGMRTRHPLLDIDGIAHGTLENSESEVTLLFFLGTTCPISAQYAPEIIDICRDYESKGTACLLVFPEPSASSANLREYLREFGYKSPALLDESHALVKKTGATVTPEAAVFSRSGKMLYRGRIDDRHASLGVSSPAASRQDLRDSLNAIVTGKPVASPLTEAVGCFIESF